MRHLVILILVIVFSLSIQAQESFLHRKLDTLKASYRTGGNSLDSIDLIYSEKYISTPGSFTSNPFGRFGNDYYTFFSGLTKQHRTIPNIEFKYTAIPHLGAYYAFGSKGTQYLVVNYNQSFSEKIHFSLSYDRNVATGAYRFNGFSNDMFSMGMLYKGNQWKHVLSVSTFKQQRSLNGGVSSFTEIESYGLEFAKVKKQNSSDSISTFKINTESDWSFLKKDTLNRFSFVLKNKLAIDKRVFREKDSLTEWYPNSIFFDSVSTRDLTQFSRMDNQIGIRFKNKKYQAEFLLDKGFWRYKTHSFQVRNEVDVLANLFYRSPTLDITSENQLNLKGANQQTKFGVHLNVKNEKLNLLVSLDQSNLLPTPMQRLYITNTLNYNLFDLKKQQTQSFRIELSTNSKQSLSFIVFGGNFQNHYYFLNNMWRNDTLKSISQITLQTKGDFSLGFFHIQPNLIFNFVDRVKVIPKYDLRTRIFVSKNFKRKGTQLNFGFDANYKSSYQLMTFDDRISLYQINSNNGYYIDYLMLDAFVSMQMDEFRMYFKMENIDHYWVRTGNSIAKNYPVIPSVMRLGITWDFFN